MICRHSKLWIPDNSSGVSNIGEQILGLWRENKKFHRPYTALLVALALSFAFWAISFAYEEHWNLLRQISSSISLAGIFFIAIPLLFRSAWLGSQKFFSRLLSTDVVISIWLACRTIGCIWNIKENIPLEIHTGEILLTLAASIAWIGFEILLAKFWGLKFERGPSDEYGWHQNLSSIHTTLTRICIISGVIVWALSPLYWEFQFLILSIATLPMATWWLTNLILMADHFGISLADPKAFQKLRRLNHLTFHSNGVLTTGNYDASEIWIDKLDEWPAASIREILWHLSSELNHPISISMQNVLDTPKTKLFELEARQLHSNLGVSASLRDFQRSKVTAFLGSSAWLRVLQCEMSDEGRRRLKSWVDDGRVCALLSLNQLIVAGVAFKDYQAKNIEESFTHLKNLNLSMSVLSSSSRRPPEAKAISETQWNLFPSERNSLVRHWIEKRPKMAIIRSWWDKNEEALPEIVFDSRGGELTSAITIESDLNALPALVQFSRSLHRTKWLIPAVLCASAIVIMLLQQLQN